MPKITFPFFHDNQEMIFNSTMNLHKLSYKEHSLKLFKKTLVVLFLHTNR